MGLQLIRAGTDAILAAMATYSPGVQQDFAERFTTFTTTNTSSTSTAAGSIIDTLTVTAVGTGRNLALVLHIPGGRHSVSNTSFGVYLLTSVNAGAYGIPAGFGRISTAGTNTTTAAAQRSINVTWRIPSVLGTTYDFQIGCYGQAAGTVTLEHFNASDYGMCLEVVNR